MNKGTIIDKAITVLSEKTNFSVSWSKGIWFDERSAKMAFGNIEGEIEIQIEKSKSLKFQISIKREIRRYQLEQIIEFNDLHKSFMLIAETISPTLKEILRENRISYLDVDGNVFINVSGFYIWIDGQINLDVIASDYNRAFTKTGLKVIFYLLLDSEAINRTYRQLAIATRVSIGNITNVMNGLENAGFLLKIDKKKFALQHKGELLLRWISGYHETLKPSLIVGKFRTLLTKTTDWKDLPTKRGEDFWGGEPAAELITDYLKATTLTLYTTRTKGTEMLDLRLIPDADKGNLTIYKKFWDHQKSDEHYHAPSLLVYTDLILTDDPRCIEVARMIYNQFLKDEFEEPERRRTKASD